MNPPLGFEIHPLSSQWETEAFDCGVPALNDYLKKFARQNHDRNIGKTFVALEKGRDRNILGFYTAVASEIDAWEVPRPHSKHLPRYPLPAVRIGRLAVDKRHQGRRIGEGLLMDALKRAERLSLDVGVYAVVVDAKDVKTAAFYSKYGFIPLTQKPLSLFLPIKTIKALFTNK